MNRTGPFTALALGILLAVPAGAAERIDGIVSTAYGPPLVTQTTQTDAQDNPCGAYGVLESFGSELDAGYAFVTDGVLYLLLAGNVMSYIGEPVHADQLNVFIDSRAGGQNTLRGDNADVGFFSNTTLNALAGLTFDPEFTPDYWFDCTVVGSVYAYSAELLDGGGGAGYYLGQTGAGGLGNLSGGTNPFGVMMTIDNSNCGGVTTGCQAASGDGVTSGVEWAIPLAAIGNPTGAIKVCAFISGAFSGPGVLNQVLGPVPPGTCGIGNAATVNFAAIPGPQYFTVPNGVTPTHPTSWGQLKLRYR